MATTSFVYGPVLGALLTKKIDFIADTIKVMLCTSSYTPAQDTHTYKSSITNEVTGTGYTAGGQALTTKTNTYTTATNTQTYDCDNPSWATSTITARYAVFYHDTGTAGTSEVILYWDFGGDVVSSAGAFTLNIPAIGLLSLTTA